MDDLRVENYDSKDVEEKKQLIKKRMVLAGGALVVTLGLFSLTGCDDVRRFVEEQPIRVVGEPVPSFPPIMNPGGSGSWFASVLIVA